MFKQTAILTAMLGLLAAAPAQAALVTLSGSTVNYTFDDSLLGLFGTPAISGNTLSFTPNAFKAKSANGDGYTLTDSTINVIASLKPGYVFSTAGLNEGGDYLLLGGGSNVNVAGQLRVFDPAQPLGKHVISSITPTPAMPLDLTGLPTRNWRAAAGFNLGAVPAYKSSASLNFTIENLLLADTVSSNSLAFIQKKFVSLNVVTAPVPEVKDWALMLAGLGLIGLQMRRRTRADGKHIQSGA